MRRVRTVFRCALVALPLAAAAAEGGNPPPPPPPSPPATAADVERLRAEVAEMRQRLGMVETEQATTAEERAIERYVLRETVNALWREEPRAKGDPQAPAAKGFIPIPGTRTSIKFGGTARLDANLDFDDAGNPNQFIPSSIPLEGSAGDSGGERFAMNAKGSRISTEFRAPLPNSDPLKIYYENDFYGDSANGTMTYRLRHLYGQAYGFTVGQTFSNFQDVDSWPDTIDYQGPNAMINRRDQQVRWTTTLAAGETVSVSLEQPAGDLTLTGLPAGSETVEHAPDITVAFREARPDGHIKLALIGRVLGDSAAGEKDNVVGGGANLSGSLKLSDTDRLVGQVAGGWGISRYLNELGGSGFDAVAEPDGTLQLLRVIAPAIGYTHQWNAEWRSNAGYGYVRLGGHDDLRAADAFEESHYVFANLLWKPGPALTNGIEGLYGRRETIDNNHGDAWRIAVMCKYDLVR